MGHIKKKQKGFTLVELLVAIAIGAVFSLWAYNSISAATGKGNVGRAADVVTTVAAAAVEWRSLRPNFTGVSMTVLANMDLIPDSLGVGTGTNPWGGNYGIAVNGTNSGQFDITITGITDAGQMASLEDKLDQAIGNNASISGTTVTVTF